MPRLTKIYTRTGDDGSTALGTGRRVGKDDLRVHTYGEVDELNAAVGVAMSAVPSEKVADILRAIQNDLFHLGADLAFPGVAGSEPTVPRVAPRHILQLERWIDELATVVGPLANFILPGGTVAAAQLQLARAICRRAERAAVQLASQESVSPAVLPYLNRLSDLLFVMARYENHVHGVAEPLWNSHA